MLLRWLILWASQILCDLLRTSMDVHLLQAAMHAAMNLTTEPANQELVGRRALGTLLHYARAANHPNLRVCTQCIATCSPRLMCVWLWGWQSFACHIIDNLTKHTANRTRLYTAELRLKRYDARKHEQDAQASLEAASKRRPAPKLNPERKAPHRPKSAAASAFLKWAEEVGADTSDKVRDPWGLKSLFWRLDAPSSTRFWRLWRLALLHVVSQTWQR